MFPLPACSTPVRSRIGVLSGDSPCSPQNALHVGERDREWEERREKMNQIMEKNDQTMQLQVTSLDSSRSSSPNDGGTMNITQEQSQVSTPADMNQPRKNASCESSPHSFMPLQQILNSPPFSPSGEILRKLPEEHQIELADVLFDTRSNILFELAPFRNASDAFINLNEFSSSNLNPSFGAPDCKTVGDFSRFDSGNNLQQADSSQKDIIQPKRTARVRSIVPVDPNPEIELQRRKRLDRKVYRIFFSTVMEG